MSHKWLVLVMMWKLSLMMSAMFAQFRYFWPELLLLISWFVNQRSIGNTDFSTGGRQFGWFTAG
ncbi:hypothetical protein, partial [Vibrio cholerae]|uniref:hypothetical protein n=1 Tax=Vibrio cholerae TaxID=666 RepID=UPI0012B17BFC